MPSKLKYEKGVILILNRYSVLFARQFQKLCHGKPETITDQSLNSLENISHNVREFEIICMNLHKQVFMYCKCCPNFQHLRKLAAISWSNKDLP